MNNAKPTDWKTEALPSQRAAILIDRAISQDEMAQIRRGLVPEQMEDKWFIYWKDDALYFHRSWTGFCVFIVQFATEGDGWKMVTACVNRNPEQYRETSDDQDRKMISYLVDVLLLHRDVAFPSEEPSSEKSTLMNWSQVGRAMLGQHPHAQQDAPADADKPRR